METEKRVPISARISESQAEELSRLAEENGVTKSDIIEAKLKGNFEKIKNQKFRNYLDQVTDICSNLEKLGEAWVLEMDAKESIIRQEVSDEVEEMKQIIADLKFEKDELIERNKDLDEDFKKYKKDCESQLKTIAANDKSIALLEASLADQKELNIQKQGQINSQKKEIELCRTKYNQLHDQLTEKNEQLSNKKVQYEMACDLKENLRKKNQSLNAKVEALQKIEVEFNLIQKEHQRLLSEKKELTEVLKNNELKLNELNTALAVGKNENENLKEKNEELKKELNAAKEELQQSRKREEKEDE